MSMLDDWITDQLPITDPADFYDKVLALDPNQFRGPHETFFVIGMQEAAHGKTETLSFYLSDNKRFLSLTSQKRILMSWILQNPQSPKIKRVNSYFKLRTLVSMAADYEGWLGMSKTEAIRKAAYEFAAQIGKEEEAEDIVESLCTQIFREIGLNGKHRKFYEDKLAEMKGTPPEKDY